MVAAVAVVGSLNLDTLLGTAQLPRRGETVIAATSTNNVGGKGANQAAAAAALTPEVHMIGRVGDDDAATRMLDDLTTRGVDVTDVLRTRGVPSGVATVVVEDVTGENLIVVAPGANGVLAATDVELPVVRTASVLLLQLEVPMAAVVAAAHHATGLVVLNPAPPAELPADLLTRVDVLVPNEWELGRLSALVVPQDGEAQLIEPPTVDAVDTTGAGDCFCGALSVALSQGADLTAATRFAVAAAALSTTGHGARGSLPDLQAVLAQVEPLSNG